LCGSARAERTEPARGQHARALAFLGQPARCQTELAQLVAWRHRDDFDPRSRCDLVAAACVCQQLLGTVAAIPETAAYGVALGAKCGLVLELHCANLLNRWALAVITSPIRRRFRDGRPAAGARAAADRRVIAGHDDWVRTSINGSPQPV
jgi:hypothetical protein